MKLPLSPLFLVFRLLLAGLALNLTLSPVSASESGHKAEGKVEAKSEGEGKGEGKAEAASEGKVEINIKPDLAKGKGERKTAAKAEAKAENKADNKTEAKAESKSETKTENRAEPGAEARQPVSMGELRDMIEHKISEVRATRGPAPVVRLQSKGSGSRQAAKQAEALAKPHASGHWEYEGPNGPAHWHELNPEFKQCGLGQRQSPIDIRDGIPVELDPIQFEYKLSAFRVIDNGHTVQVNVEPGNRIMVNGRRYELVQFHFHRPSEERLNGRQFDMVAHLVHKDLEGKLAVIAVLIEEGKGHPVIQQVWNNLPLEKNTEQAGLQGIDLLQLLPEDRHYVTYMGSLTTPPCTEGVLWMVMKKPVGVSAQQISIFSRLHPMNARPVQPIGDRLIKDGQ